MRGYVFATFTTSDESLPIRITLAGVAQNQHRIVRVEGWDHFQWIQCTQGMGELNIEGETFLIGPGQGILIFPEANHEYHPVQKPWMMDWASFDGPLVRQTLTALNVTQSQILTISQPEITLKIIGDIYSSLLANNPRSNLECSSLLYSLLMEIFYLSAPSNSSSKQQKYDQLLPVFNYIEEHYHEPITLADMAIQLHVSEQYLCQLFRQAIGIRPFEYVNRIKIRKAKELILHESRMDIQSVARNVGYDNYGYFFKTFKKLEGLAPSEFRLRYRSSKPALIPYE